MEQSKSDEKKSKSKKSIFLILLFLLILILLILMSLVLIRKFLVSKQNIYSFGNFPAGEFGRTLELCEPPRCSESCYDINKNGSFTIPFDERFQPSKSSLKIDANIWRGHQVSVNIFSMLDRAIFHISIRLNKNKVVLSHEDLNSTWQHNETVLKNRWFKRLHPFTLHVTPLRIDNQTVVFHVDSSKLNNGTRHPIGETEVHLEPKEWTENHTRLEVHGPIHILKYCMTTFV